ncbi:MAG: hypothetical protein ACP5RI_03320 [Candidatus Micrarchaeia archaeon]
MEKIEKDVKLGQFKEIYTKLVEVLGEQPVVIGGKAISFLCSKNRRPTKDIDLVVSEEKLSNIREKDCSDENSTASKLIKEGFIPKWNDDGSLKGLSYGDIDIDLYYSHSVNGISIENIKKYKVDEKNENLNIKNFQIKIVSPAILLLMKYDSDREKDQEDVKRLLDTYWNGKLGLFIKNNLELLGEILKEAESGKSVKKGNKINRFLADYEDIINELLKQKNNIKEPRGLLKK